MVWIARVESVTADSDGGKRIKARINNIDDSKVEAPDAFPLMPKMLHVTPKVGEAVLIFSLNDNPEEQRFYLGPIISQYQEMYEDLYYDGALKLIGGKGKKKPDIINIDKTHGAFATNEDIAIYGRKDSDIILGDTDIRIRCGAHLVDPVNTTDIGFNKANPSFIKLKYHENALTVNKPIWDSILSRFYNCPIPKKVSSTANIIAQEINLISTDSGEPALNVGNTDVKTRDSKNNGQEGVSDEEIKKFINTAHPLPYGDVLIKLMDIFFKAFKSHTHKYHQLEPVHDITYDNLQTVMNEIGDTMLSKNVRIN